LSEITRWRPVFFIALGIAAAVGYSWFLVGDILYSFFILRRAQLNNNLPAAYQVVLRQLSVYVLLAPLAWLATALFSRRPALRRLLIVCVIGLMAHNISLLIIQRGVAYSTRYGYGASGASQLKAFFQTRPPGTVLTSIEGYVAGVDQLRFGSLRVFEWNDPQFVYRTLKIMQPDLVVYGLGTHMVYQLTRALRDKDVSGYLSANYLYRRIGSYEVFTKRSKER
jgi:hypothetical protein